MQEEKKGAYRNILKGTAVFGGVQVFNILINLIKGKLIAIILGPLGMGISALLTTTIGTITQFASLGISVSAMRELAQSHTEGDMHALSEKIKIYRRLVLFTGIGGALIAIALSPLLSHIAFHNYNYTIPFALLSLFVLCSILSNAEVTLLQGTGQLKKLAKSTLIGPLTGLLISVPLYYFFGSKAIAPAMVILAAITFLINHYFARKIPTEPIIFSWVKFKGLSKIWISLGLLLTVSTLLGTFANFLVNSYISHNGNITDVGLFQSARSISEQYVGIVFTAMAIDYYPKLAAISNDNNKVKEIVNNQSEIVILLISPIIMILIITAPILVKVLLSNEFLVITPVVKWMSLGLFFKAASYPLSYIPLAKGDNNVFFWVEGVFGNIILLSFNIIAYHFYGLTGLGISFLLFYMVYYFLVVIISVKRYSFSYFKGIFKTFFILLVIISTIFLLSLKTGPLYVLAELGIFAIGAILCLIELNRRMALLKLIKERFKLK